MIKKRLYNCTIVKAEYLQVLIRWNYVSADGRLLTTPRGSSPKVIIDVNYELAKRVSLFTQTFSHAPLLPHLQHSQHSLRSAYQ